MRDSTGAHVVTIQAGIAQLARVKSYELTCSMVEPADSFRIAVPFSLDAWNTLHTDQRIQIAIDGVIMMDGFVDSRRRSAKDGTLEVSGRDKVGRLVQTSIPTTTGYDGLDLLATVKKLAAPWFGAVVLSDARNRAVRRGKGHRAAAAGEPAIFLSKTRGRGENRSQHIDPGEMCWAVIEELCSSAGLLVWSSADGRELVIGRPNYSQDPQYLFRHSTRAGSTVIDMTREDTVADRYAMMEVYGIGRGDASGYGGDVANRGAARNGPNADGTGRDFAYPKRMSLPQNAIQDADEAGRVAAREMAHRDFRGRTLAVSTLGHGQTLTGSTATLYAPNTLARVIDDDLYEDGIWLVHSLTFKGDRQSGETTDLQLVPRDTVFVA